MREADLSFGASQRGPITYVMNGKGIHPWLPELITAPGWTYLVSSPMGNEQTPLCWRCVPALHKLHDGRERIEWRDAVPGPDDRCSRCERDFWESALSAI